MSLPICTASCVCMYICVFIWVGNTCPGLLLVQCGYKDQQQPHLYQSICPLFCGSSQTLFGRQIWDCFAHVSSFTQILSASFLDNWKLQNCGYFSTKPQQIQFFQQQGISSKAFALSFQAALSYHTELTTSSKTLCEIHPALASEVCQQIWEKAFFFFLNCQLEGSSSPYALNSALAGRRTPTFPLHSTPALPHATRALPSPSCSEHTHVARWTDLDKWRMD